MEQSPTYDGKEFGRQFQRKSKIKDPGVYLIACEGTKDEPRYIKEFIRKKRVRAKVFIAEREEGDYGSNPWHVYDILRANMKKMRISAKNKSTHCWIMVDRDTGRMRELREVKKRCDAKGVSIAYSSPCIELWFLLHYKELGSLSSRDLKELDTPKNLKKHLKRNCFDTAKGFSVIFPKTNIAIDRARAIDKPHIDFPEDFCTRVYKLVQELLEFD